IHIADHTTNHNRTKHIDIQHFFVREHVHSGAVEVSYINTQEQLADILTKATKNEIFIRLRNALLQDITQ
ncbi:MAG TPA: Ty1/Copia family ribonuclease HI, partial [Bacteroidia bacterium]|nr:Ty1/Copia family ribonuclease HI [Bacteroidia bacterium]